MLVTQRAKLFGLLRCKKKGEITNQLKGHAKDIEYFKSIPGTNNFITAGWDGAFLFAIPTTREQQRKEHHQQHQQQQQQQLQQQQQQHQQQQQQQQQ